MMKRLRFAASSVATIVLAVTLLSAPSAPEAAGKVLDPSMDGTSPKAIGTATAVLAGGCFWGMEGVFEHVRGVISVVSGYAGGNKDHPTYDEVSAGDTEHAESVRITYDSTRITYGQLLNVFFTVAHDPTELNRQGPDSGSQYRSAVFYTDGEQKRAAQAYIAELQAAHRFPRPIVTQVTPLTHFYEAEAYHQGYMARHPYQPYIVFNDLPKIARLRHELSELYVEH